MVRIFIICLLLSSAACKNNAKQKQLQSISTQYRIYASIDSLKSAFPTIQEQINFNKIELQWSSLPPNDTLFAGLHKNDTLVEIVSLSYDSSDIVLIGGKTINLERVKLLERFSGKGAIQLAHFPELYDYENSYILEGVVAGCTGIACTPFYLVIQK